MRLSPCSRREFMAQSGLAAVGIAAAEPGTASAAVENSEDPIRKLLEGNKRFVAGQDTAAQRQRSPERRAQIAEGQKPFAAIVACADSRVAPELLFDQGLGDLFVVRVAGNVIDRAGAVVKGSIEYAVVELGVSLVLVLGHSQCGAIKAALKHFDADDKLPGSLEDLVGAIKPAIARVKDKPGDRLELAMKANVEAGVARLKTLEPIVGPAFKQGKLKVVGASYDLRSGQVSLLE